MFIDAATAAAKPLQSCLKPDSYVHGILQAGILECVAISFSNMIYESESCSVLSDSATPWTIQAMAFFSPEYWSG